MELLKFVFKLLGGLGLGFASAVAAFTVYYLGFYEQPDYIAELGIVMLAGGVALAFGAAITFAYWALEPSRIRLPFGRFLFGALASGFGSLTISIVLLSSLVGHSLSRTLSYTFGQEAEGFMLFYFLTLSAAIFVASLACFLLIASRPPKIPKTSVPEDIPESGRGLSGSHAFGPLASEPGVKTSCKLGTRTDTA